MVFKWEAFSRGNDDFTFLFVVDTLIFCDIHLDQMKYLHCVLCLEAISDLKINIAKSLLVLVGEVQEVNDLASLRGCKVDALPMMYLGLPLDSSFIFKFVWNRIVEKIEQGLASCKKLFLSKRGR